MRALTAIALAALAASPTAAFADDDRTGAPYFQVHSDDPNTDRLPLKKTRADVTVSGVIAHVHVTQTYANEGSRPIEAVYVFPGSTRSAVFGMRMRIADRTIVAKIEKKAEARRLYEAAKAQGKSASLLEQKRPNVFTMNVANIMPGDVIEVSLDYTELLVPEDGVYELVYPTVVGPRYRGEHSGAKEAWVHNPYGTSGEAPTYGWDIAVDLEAGMAISAVRSPSHTIAPSFTAANRVQVELDDPTGGNRDFVLRYRLAGDSIETGLLTFEDGDERFFLMMMEPPQRVAPSIIPAREYIFVVDVSGSMRGFPIETSKRLMRSLLAGLRTQDRFNVLMFAGGSRALAEESLPVTRDNIDRAIRVLDGQRGGGGTQILDALRRTLKMPRAQDMSTSIIVVTDGYVSVEKATFELIRDNLGDANVFSFGIGKSVNRYIIEGIARAGMGQPFVVLDSKSAPGTAEKFRQYVDSPVLTNVRMSIQGFETYDVEPKALPDLFARRPIIAFGKYRGPATGSIHISGITGASTYSRTLDVGAAASSQDRRALRYLWARHKIARLSDMGRVDRTGSIAEEVTQLGLRYNLMTEHTSFVAVDSMVRNTDGTSTTVSQPLPLPQDVPNAAVGGAMAYRAFAKPALKRGAYGSGSVGTRSGGYGPSGGGRGKSAERQEADRRASKPMPPVASPAPTVVGSLSRSAITKVFRRHQRQIRQLYERALQRNPSLVGKIVLQLEIGADGRVASARVASSTLDDPKLERQIIRLVRRWRFGLPTGGGTVQVRYPLVFRPTAR